MRLRSLGLILTISLCACLLFHTVPEVKADETVLLKAEAGFGGYARWGQAFPLQVTVENNGPGITGRLELSTTTNNNSRVLINQDIQLPRGSKKQINMYVPSSESKSFSVDLFSGKRKVATCKPRITILQPQEVLVGVLSSDPSALNHLTAIKLPGAGQRITVIHLQAHNIPDNSLLLENLDVLAFNNFSTSALSEKQMTSIESWTEGGGMLVLAGGAGWQKTLGPFSKDLLPVSITGSRASGGLRDLGKIAGQGLPPGSSFIISAGKLVGGKAPVYDGDAPVLVEKQKGNGTVVYLGFDPAMKPFSDWQGNAALWQNLITGLDPHHVISAGTARGQMRRSPQEMTWALRNFPGSDLPTTGLLGGVLLIYLIVLGPGVYLLLKRFDRRDWGWVAIPVLALLMFSFTYLGAFKARGRDVYTNVISLLRLDNDCEYARLSSYIGVFAPTKKSYFLELPGDGLVNVFPVEGGDMAMRVATVAPGNTANQLPLLATVKQGAGSGVDFNDASRWSMRCLLSEESIPRPGKIASNLVSANGRISGAIKNQTGRVLYDCVVFNRYGYQRIPRMAPGQTVKVDFLSRFAPARGPAIQRIFESYPVHRPRDYMDSGSRKSRINQQILDMASNTLYLSDDGLMFFADSAEPVKKVFKDNNQGMNYYYTIVISSLQLKLNQGEKVSIPPGIVNGRFLGADGNNYYQDNYGYSVDNGSITFQLDLPFSPAQLKVNELKVYIGSNDYRRAGYMKIKLYNCAGGKWEDRAYQPSGILLQDWRSYVSEDGAIKVQMSSGDDKRQTNINVSGVTISLEGSLTSRLNDETTALNLEGGQ
ncbi:MAG: hypothetical protein ABFD08_19530 [Syntrophomonas sp.]